MRVSKGQIFLSSREVYYTFGQKYTHIYPEQFDRFSHVQVLF